MDVYDKVYAEVVMTSRFDENVDYKYNIFRKNRYEKRGGAEGRRKFSYL